MCGIWLTPKGKSGVYKMCGVGDPLKVHLRSVVWGDLKERYALA